MHKPLEVRTLEEARSEFSKYWEPSPREETISLLSSRGRILAEEVRTNLDLPPFDRAIYDGFAVRAEDTFGAEEDDPVELRCVGEILAGQPPELEIGENQCVEISTGAPIPRGANAVVMVEDTTSLNDGVEVRSPVSPGENIADKGLEMKSGDIIVGAGERITPQIYASLLACGVTEVSVFTKPKVGVISSGEELVDIHSELEMGQIYDVNGPAISSAVEDCGADSTYLGIMRDDYAAIEEKIRDGLKEFDVLITSGGTSAGSGDLIPSVIDGLEGEGVVVHGLAQKPGKPTFLALVEDKPIFGLPGYPVSAFMIFDQLVAPYLRAMASEPEPERREVEARLTKKILSARGRRELVPARIRWGEEALAEPLREGSGAITSLAQADGYFIVPLGQEIVDEDEKVVVRLFGGVEIG